MNLSHITLLGQLSQLSATVQFSSVFSFHNRFLATSLELVFNNQFNYFLRPSLVSSVTQQLSAVCSLFYSNIVWSIVQSLIIQCRHTPDSPPSSLSLQYH